MAVIRGESCFEKNAFEDTEKPTKTRVSQESRKNISGNIRDIEKKNLFCFEALLTAFFIP